MSSPTILFVLHELRRRQREERLPAPEAAVAMAFGPGLVAELAHLTYVPVGIVLQPEDITERVGFQGRASPSPVPSQ
jgi:hypothetical protein